MNRDKILPVGFFISGFRSLAKIYLPLNNFVVLVGPNDSGKTSFIEALNLFQTLVVEGKSKTKLRSGYFSRIKLFNKKDEDYHPVIKLIMYFDKERLRMFNNPKGILDYFSNNKSQNRELIGIGVIIKSKVPYSELINYDFSEPVGISVKKCISIAELYPENNEINKDSIKTS
ncbi:MAG: AAA family ATPase, partial [Crenarchaeota archaeon]|nr:AAA family ATPase [Thermoproteota archaeon]